MSDLEGWALLHSKLPPQALKPLSESVYGVSGLTDVNEGFLIQRLFASKLPWEWRLVEQRYLGTEDRTSQGGKNYRVYLASAHGVLEIEGREFHGAGAHDNRKLDASYKGAATVAFKNACKLAGLTIELFKDGKAMDFIYESAEKNPATHEAPPVEAPPASQPLSPGELGQIEELYALGKALPKTPQLPAAIKALVEDKGFDFVRKRLIAAHNLQCGTRCEHFKRGADSD